MDDGRRYYYSVDGSVVRGPVATDIIRRLCEQRILTAASLLCPEGESEWQEVVPESFAPAMGKVKPVGPPLIRSLAKGPKSRQYVAAAPTVGIGRLAFLLGYLGCAAIQIVLYLSSRGWAHDPERLRLMAHNPQLLFILAGANFGLGIVTLVLLAYRLRNIGHSGWMCLLALVPILGLALLIYSFFAAPGSVGDGSKHLVNIFLATLVLFLLIALFTWHELSLQQPHMR